MRHIEIVTGLCNFPVQLLPRYPCRCWCLEQKLAVWGNYQCCFLFSYRLLRYLQCCLPNVLHMLSCIWNYITVSVFKFLTNVSSLLLSLQLSKNTAGVVKMAEILVESRLSPAGLLSFGKAESGDSRTLLEHRPWYCSFGILFPPARPPIQFLKSTRNLQELGSSNFSKFILSVLLVYLYNTDIGV